MRVVAALALLLILALVDGLGAPAQAEAWGGIEPGVSTLDVVRSRYGAPSKESHAKVEGYDTTQWVYEGAQAPGGIQRMTIDYGLLTPQGYKANVVRVIRLEPKTMVFGRTTVVQGFGVPDGMSTQNDQETFFYKSGLLVTFNKEGTEAIILNFTPPQPDQAPAPAAPKR
jgi:hypothetical protein